MSRREKIPDTDASPAEWAWLTAAPDANPFLGFHDTGEVTSWARLQDLWERHEATIRAAWGSETPPLPYGHPAEAGSGGKVGCPWTHERRERWGR